MKKRIIVLIKYKPNEVRDVFPNGEILYESQEILQMVENDGIAWDDLKLIDYSEKNIYQSDLRDFHDDKNELDKYKIILLKPYSYLKDKYSRIKYVIRNIFGDDTTIPLDKTKKETPKQKRLRLVGNRVNVDRFPILLEKTKVQSRQIYWVNLIKTREIAMYPVNYVGKQISGKKALDIYSRIAYKYNTKHENEFLYFSDVINTIADNTGTDTEWETFAIVKYKSFKSLMDFNYEPRFQRALIHKDAGVAHTYVYATYFNNENAESSDSQK